MTMNRTTRLLAGTAAAGFALMLGATTAHAAADTDLNAAQQAAAQPQATSFISHFFVNVDQRSAGKTAALSAADANAAAATKAPRLVGSPLQVNTLNPAFVTGTSKDVATFGYVAVHARSATGQDASVWMKRQGDTWKAINVTTGTEEITYPAQAGADTVFTEPQINAWYRLHDGKVLPLNDVARTSVGANGVTLAGYQRLVHDKYADKQPGSAYANDRKLGGYSPAAGQSPLPDNDTGLGWLAVPGAAVVMAGAAGVVMVRRRRTGRAV